VSTTADRQFESSSSDAAQLAAWAASGAMWLTGRRNEPPLGPPRGLGPKLGGISGSITRSAAALGSAITLDPLALLGERAAIAGLGRQGAISCGGSTRLLRAGSRWIAVSLARPDDVDLVDAWLERVLSRGDIWDEIAVALVERDAGELVERATLLGLPVAALPRQLAPASIQPQWAGLPVFASPIPGTPPAPRRLRGVRVIDLGSLWAGPLCGAVLAEAGAEVIKVESTARPDGARAGPTGFFDLLNGAKGSVALDLGSSAGVSALRSLIERADVVIEASRPRALEQLGLDAASMVSTGRTRVWVSITGYGRRADVRQRVAFGDDAAVAGGLVAWNHVGPCFCADAVADPATGLVAAAAALVALLQGGRWLLDVPMAGVAAHLAGPTIAADLSTVACPPVARQPPGPAPRLGAHTAGLVGELDTSP